MLVVKMNKFISMKLKQKIKEKYPSIEVMCEELSLSVRSVYTIIENKKYMRQKKDGSVYISKRCLNSKNLSAIATALGYDSSEDMIMSQLA